MGKIQIGVRCRRKERSDIKMKKMQSSDIEMQR
jgi:hypothetical protein